MKCISKSNKSLPQDTENVALRTNKEEFPIIKITSLAYLRITTMDTSKNLLRSKIRPHTTKDTFHSRYIFTIAKQHRESLMFV